MIRWSTYFFILLVIPTARVFTLFCSRYPANTITSKSPVDENFAIFMHNNPQTYILGQEYEIFVNAYNGRRFISFSLSLENENGTINYSDDLGHFEITDSVETHFSPNCINMVESTNTNPKTSIPVTWVAPSEPRQGCILIRATILQHRDVWFMDDGGLTKRICEEVTDDIESQSALVEKEKCCACDDARYELTFEGTWSRNFHPKDFPPKGWITRFNYIIGASHTANYRFWERGALATAGMQEYAEHGSTRQLERDFSMNFKNNKIRTIVKARGPAFPNLNGQSIASIRVDPDHHLLSLAAKIEPSPDWFVGVSGLELCMINCTWLDEKVVNLYPWDVGTDAGPSYTSADQPQKPPDVIRRMSSEYPSDPRSPFFDESGEPMKPFARLTIKKQRTYERMCADMDSNNNDVQRECATHPWSAWTECTAKCGRGMQYRKRVFKQPDIVEFYKCDEIVVIEEQRECMGNTCDDPENEIDDRFGSQGEPSYGFRDAIGNEGDGGALCQLSRWDDWSECSNECGEGKMMRRRYYINSNAEQECQNVHYMKLKQEHKCMGNNCGDNIEDDNRERFAPQPTYRNNQQTAYRNNPQTEYFNIPAQQNYRNNQRGYENNEEIENNLNRYGQNDNDDESDSYGGSRRYQNNRMDQEYQRNREDDVEIEEEEPENEDSENERGIFEVGNLNKIFDERYDMDAYDNKQRVKPNHKLSLKPYEKNQQMQWQQPQQQRLPEVASFNPKYQMQQQHHSQAQQQQFSNVPGEQQQQLIDPTSLEQENLYSKATSNNEAIPDMDIAYYCFEKLEVTPCRNTTTIGNFWFYNYCADECMLFAADSCDRNANKFTTYETCEHICRKTEYAEFLRRKQAKSCRQRYRQLSNNNNKQRHRFNRRHLQRLY